jgi:hypothetical protein
MRVASIFLVGPNTSLYIQGVQEPVFRIALTVLARIPDRDSDEGADGLLLLHPPIIRTTAIATGDKSRSGNDLG